MTLPSQADLLDVAIDAVYAAGRLSLGWFRNGVGAELKADMTPVTEADRACEQRMREIIGKRFPDHGILGEEFPETIGSGRVRWILDPIDGTKTFLRGVPFYGAMVGVEIDGEALVGAVYLPALDEMLAGAKGLGAWHQGRRTHVSNVSTFDQSLLLSYDSLACRRRSRGYAELAEKAQIERTWGDCYAYVLLATGRAELVVDPAMQLWDCAPMLPIIEEAGGRFTDWKGRRTIAGGDAVATNGPLHDQVLQALSAPA